MELPLELIQEILNSSGKEIINLCSSTPLYRELCSSRSFWRRKFQHDNLPLLQEGYDFMTWYAIYKSSLLARDRTEILIEEFTPSKEIYIDLAAVQDPSLLIVPGITEEDVEFFLILSHEKEDIEKARKELKELNEELEDIFIDAQLGYEEGIEISGEIQEALDRREELQDIIFTREKLKVTLYINREENINYEFHVNYGSGSHEYLEVPINKEELYKLLYRLYYYEIPLSIRTDAY